MSARAISPAIFVMVDKLRVYRPLILVLLLTGFFALGYQARQRCTAAEAVGSSAQRSAPTGQGTRVAAASLGSANALDFRPLETLVFVVNSLRQQYVEQIDDQLEGKMARAALAAMLAQLDDPNCRFLEPEERELAESAAEGKFRGIGAVLGVKKIKAGSITEEHLVVVAPLQSGPAAEAGIQPGDHIAAIGGKSVLPFNPFQRANELAKTEVNKKIWSPELKKKMDAEKKRIENGIPILEAEKKLIGEVGGELQLTILRKGARLQVKVKPREFAVEPVATSLAENGKVGCIRITCFTSNAGDQVGKAVAEFRSKGVESLVLDLRNCVGGGIEPVLQVAKHFLGGSRMGTLLRSRGRKLEIDVPLNESDQSWSGPMVVLVNRGTARTAELLAAALKEKHRVLVGENTYGDLSQTTLIEQADGSAVVFTTGVFLDSKGVNYNAKGVPVDVQIAASAAGDRQFDGAVRIASSSARGS